MAWSGAVLLAILPNLVLAHGLRVGELLIDHPYALPMPPATRSAAVYFRSLTNRGSQPERLLGARCTAVAQRVEIQRSRLEQGVVRMRAIAALELPTGSTVKLRHGGDLHLMLLDLHRPLLNGERFELELQFERAGRQMVTVWVQQPRDERSGRNERGREGETEPWRAAALRSLGRSSLRHQRQIRC